MIKKYSCPSCGGEISFQSSLTVFSVCSFCRSTLIRNDAGLESIGKMAQLIDDTTPLKLGTSGRYQGSFSLIGRVQVAWKEGFWNEWFARFSDGRQGWIAEAQGFWMLSFAVSKPENLPKAAALKPEMQIGLDKILYTVDDIKPITYSYAEGELPFMAAQGYSAISVDLHHGENDFASITYEPSGNADVFIGKYVDFEQFSFQNLRQIDGW